MTNNSDVVYVHAYTKDDGTKVKAHYRSKPDGVGINNYQNTENITGAAANIDPTKAIIMHELGHSITVAGENKEFWSEIKTIQNAHNKDLGAFTYKKFKEDKDKLNLTNFISAYALYNKYEFVAEAFADAMLSKNPCKYSQDVLKCIDKHFKLSTKDIKQLRLFNALKEVLNMDKQTIINKKGDTQSEQFWVENYGLGYPTQEGFEKWLETQDEQED